MLIRNKHIKPCNINYVPC